MWLPSDQPTQRRQEPENLADIINSIIDELIKSKFQLPAFKRLVRLARAARTVVSNDHYTTLVNELTDEQKTFIDTMIGLIKPEIVEETQANEIFTWAKLKTEPKKPTHNNIKSYIAYVKQLTEIRERFNINLDFILPARLEALKEEALIADIDDMKAMRPLKRYALAVILIELKASAAIDDLIQVFIAWIKGIEANAKSKLEMYRIAQASKTDSHILLLYKLLLVLKSNQTPIDKIQAMEAELGTNADAITEECREYLGLTEESHLPWMLKPYNNKRSAIFTLLDHLSILSATQDKSIEEAIKFMMHHRHSNKELIMLDDKDELQPHLELLTEGWFKIVTGGKKEKNGVVKKINRHYYEIALCTVLMGDLSCGDAYVDGAFLFDDPSKQFISWEDFENEVDGYCELQQVSKEGCVANNPTDQQKQ